MAKTKQKAEYGDFQTPEILAREICSLLRKLIDTPASVVEPTCGRGNLLFAALNEFKTVKRAVGLDISEDHVITARNRVSEENKNNAKIEILEGSFFDTEWEGILAPLPDPLLVIGNPPWVTNAELGALKSVNLPEKTNFQNHNGFDARTGKSNFDISEWILIRVLHWLNNRNGALAMLCKTSVARKTLFHAWKNGITISSSTIYRIDALVHFQASVDACLLICRFAPSKQNFDTPVFSSLGAVSPEQTIGFRDGEIVSSTKSHNLWKHLRGEETIKWRSGVKHDCSKVMELVREGENYRNGLGELVSLEEEFLYPMMKSSEVANGAGSPPKRWMIVTQRSVQDDTALIRSQTPRTWAYLEKHGELLDARASSIYKKRSRFSVFGVGEYSFAPWKVAISGFYKKLEFSVIGRYDEKPVILDDTCYFTPCETKEEAEYIAFLLNSKTAKKFFESFIFWDAKRPITVDLLRRIDLLLLESEIMPKDSASFWERK